MSTHRNLSGTQLHDAYHFVQESDPGAVGANLYWLKVSTGVVKRRNSTNAGWDTISPATGFTDPLTTKGDLIVRSTVTDRLPIGADGQVLTADATQTFGLKWATPTGGGGGTQPAIVWDQKTAGTDGGAYPTVRTWQTRTLNTVHSDAASIVSSLASNQVTLAAGTYQIFASAPSWGLDRNKIRLRNVTDSTTALVGQAALASGSGAPSILNGIITIAGSKAFRIEQWGVVAPNVATDLGLAAIGSAITSGEIEIFATIVIWKF